MPSLLERLSRALAPQYELERELASGGMGTVFLGRDAVLDRRVAIKVLRPEQATPTAAKRLLREARILARLSHPNIVPIHHAGEAPECFHEEGAECSHPASETPECVYYVMDYIEGNTLEERLKSGPLSVDEAVKLGRDLLDALAAAHGHGIIHRDVKPSNVFLAGDRALLGDFGIAKRIETTPTEFTSPDQRVGTPGYMAPEQVIGGDVTPATDIWAMGMVLYEALTGRRCSVLAAGAKIDWSDVPRGLEPVLRRALEWLPEGRWPDAAAFRAALTRDREGAPRRRRLAWRNAAIVGTLAVALGGLAASRLLSRLPDLLMKAEAADFFSAQDQVVVAEFGNETDEAALGLAIREAIGTDLDQSPYVNVVERAELHGVLGRMRLPETSRLDAGVAVEIARREGYPAVVAGGVAPLGVGYQLTVRIVEASTGEVAVRLRQTAASDAEVVAAVEKLARLTRRHLGESLASVRRSEPLPRVTTASLEALQLHARGAEYGRRGDYASAIPLLQQAVELDTAFAAAYRGLSIYYTNIGDPASAQANADLAYHHAERLVYRERYLIGALYHTRRGRPDSAAHYYRRLLDRSPNEPTALNNLGDLYEVMGRYEDALPLYRQALEFGANPVNLLNVASAARTLGRHELADSALALMLESFPEAWHTWRTQAMNAYYAGDFARLEQVAREMAAHRLPFPRSYGRWLQASVRAMSGQVSAALALAASSTEFAVEAGSRYFEYEPLRVVEYAALAAGMPERAQSLLGKVRDPATLEAAPRFRYQTLGYVATGHALAGDLAEARGILASMDSLAEAADFRPPWIGEHVRAIIALAEESPEASLEHLRRARAAGYGFLHHSSRLLLGHTYVALGRLAEAAAQYDTLTRTYRLNFDEMGLYGPIRPLAHERLGSLYLALGDTVAAVRHLTTFTELWQNADSELQPRVESAQRLLTQLVGEPS